MTAHTLLLGDDWDIHTDNSGNLARTFEAYSIAQNVANACRLFTQDAWYFPEKGIPHFVIELNEHPKLAILSVRLREAAIAVEGVKDCKITLLNDDERDLSGIAALTLDNGEQLDVRF